LAEKIKARKPQVLEPIDTDDVPLEIRPVVLALNNLLESLRRALVSESRFTANAAHELQTPLAAIKAEVQRHQRQVRDNGNSQMLARISTRVSRATNTVTQLLTLARLDPEQEFQREQVNLREIVIEAIAEEGGTAMDRGLDIRVPEGPDMRIEGHPDWLKILVRNLVANAFRHSPAHSVVEITLNRQPGCVRLRIGNDCESIPREQRRQLTDRFYRLPGNAADGVGLGLSIVARIVDLHGADLRLDQWRGDRGFLAQVDFPTAQPGNVSGLQ
jgi:signal transduction histidine kinase